MAEDGGRPEEPGELIRGLEPSKLGTGMLQPPRWRGLDHLASLINYSPRVGGAVGFWSIWLRNSGGATVS